MTHKKNIIHEVKPRIIKSIAVWMTVAFSDSSVLCFSLKSAVISRAFSRADQATLPNQALPTHNNCMTMTLTTWVITDRCACTRYDRGCAGRELVASTSSRNLRKERLLKQPMLWAAQVSIPLNFFTKHRTRTGPARQQQHRIRIP